MFSQTACYLSSTVIRCVVLALISLAMAMPAAAQLSRAAPEAASGVSAKSLYRSKSYMVSAANPLAVRAGVAMLRKGGSAVDAAIATQLVLNLVEPQSSGIGGGAFLLHWDEKGKKLKTYDGREQAPRAARADRFMRDGKRLPFRKVVKSGLSVGVPGLVRLLAVAHRRHGRLPWSELFEPAIRLSREGFAVSPRLNFLLGWMGPRNFAPAARDYFFDKAGGARPVGYRLRNRQFALTLERVRDGGANAFYDGVLAAAIVEAVAKAPNFRGDVSADDLKAYMVKERPPVCVTYRRHRICGMGPPSSGALTVGQILKLSERFDLGTEPQHALNSHAMHILGEAGKLAYADRGRFMADSDFVNVPAGLLNDTYLAQRAKLIRPRRVLRQVVPGNPPAVRASLYGRDDTRESNGTTHISIVDADGNAVSMTSTIESAFGSGVWAGGFLLNNELTDFSFRPVDVQGRAIANRVEALKRPRSSMAPTIVFAPDGQFKAALGSPGGSRIILYVTKALVALIDWKLDPQAATALTNFGSRGRGFEIEFDRAVATSQRFRPWAGAPTVWHGIRLRAIGHDVRPVLMTSGLHIVMRANGGLEGGADPRREGIALGD